MIRHNFCLALERGGLGQQFRCSRRVDQSSGRGFVPVKTSVVLYALLLACVPVCVGQSFNASISGTVTDPSGATVPNTELTLTSIDTGAIAKTNSDADGLYAFRNLQRGAYEIKATAAGFRTFVQRGLSISINDSVRVDIKLEVGTETQIMEVSADASPINFENGELKGTVTPETIQDLPLIVGGAVRSAVTFIMLQPGVNTGASGNAFNARTNGGLQSGDEAVLDGVSAQEGAMSQSGYVALGTDMPVSPESVGEISILSSNYEPQYGSSLSGNIVVSTKSGTNQMHGSAYWFHRNTALNARPFGANSRPKDLEHDFGWSLGGPAKLAGLWTSHNKTFFFVNFEGYRFKGGVNKPILSVPTDKMKQGDFSEWPNPIYDPASTRVVNGQLVRTQFPNNVIPHDRIANSLANEWLKFVPSPNRPGVLNNYEVPLPVTTIAFANSNGWDVRVDEYIGDRDHFAGNYHYRGTHPFGETKLPRVIDTADFRDPNYSNISRLNWDHTFTPTLLNNFNFGYLDLRSNQVNLSDALKDQIPTIKGVGGTNHEPAIRFLEDYDGYGGNAGGAGFRPSYIANDLVTWIHGTHTLKFGGEFRGLGENNTGDSNNSGTFNFTRLNTGILGVNSGNAIASFLLEAVGNANSTFYTLTSNYPRQRTYVLHAGDTWKINPKISLNYGVRWDVATPTLEKRDNMSFFDFGPNPGAGGRPGRLAFAGDKWGPASAGDRFPESTYYKAFQPRIGIAYSPDTKTVVRGGYGIYYTQAFYPGWGGGIAQDGFNANVSFSSTDGGLTPAFILSQGFPQNFQHPPFIDPSYRNGQNLNYRPPDGNRRPYSQQWNLTIERQIPGNFLITTAYVANKGTRLPSRIIPINALDPQLLSTYGSQLYDQFQPGQTVLDGVPIPYAGWREQMTGCAPTLAQALLPYPQFCSGLYGANESVGSSTYHSFQLKAEKKFSNGMWMLASYTFSKLLTTSENTQSDVATWSGLSGVISPFERQRNKGLSQDDVPHILSWALTYELPIGRGKRFLNVGGLADRVVGGWQINSILRITSGTPFFFRSKSCTVPEQFRVQCIPGVLPGANPWAQDKSSFDPNKPLFAASAFEPPDNFNLYYGSGSRITNLRGFGYHNEDFSLVKNTRFTERVGLQIRAEAFNVFNWHTFTNGANFGGSAFTTDVSSPSFGLWNGNVSSPRNLQIGAKVIF
jgi:hypothetical protein